MYSTNDTYQVASIADVLSPKMPRVYSLDSTDIAIMVAVEAHAGQLDKAGRPYILHPLRVGARGLNAEEQICGFLHDVIEDTDYDKRKLLNIFGTEVYEALLCLTHTKGEPYTDYVDRCIQNPIARAVKGYDVTDNWNRIDGLSESEQIRLRKKYQYPIRMLGLDLR